MNPTYHSRRLPEHLDADALSEAHVGPQHIDLALSNPTLCGFTYPAWPHDCSDIFARPYEAQALGPMASREALADWLSRHGRMTHATQVMLTASTSEALSYLFKLALNPGDQVAGAQPGYPLVPHLAELEGLKATVYRYTFEGAKGWRLDLESVADALAQGARAIVCVSPHNPTGACLDACELKALAVLCNRYQALVIFDEVFAPYHHTAPHHRLLPMDDFDRAVSLGGLSKAGLMPQAKLSWIAVHGNRAFRAATMAGLEWIGDAYLSLGPMQHALPALLPALAAMQQQALARVAENRQRLIQLLALHAVASVAPAAAGWYAVLRLDSTRLEAAGWGRNGLDVAERLLQRERVQVHSGYLYDFMDGPVLVGCLLGPPQAQSEGWRRVVSHVERGDAEARTTE